MEGWRAGRQTDNQTFFGMRQVSVHQALDMLVVGAVLSCFPAGWAVLGPFEYVCKPGRRYTCSHTHGASNSTITGLPKVIYDDREVLTSHACPALLLVRAY